MFDASTLFIDEGYTLEQKKAFVSGYENKLNSEDKQFLEHFAPKTGLVFNLISLMHHLPIEKQHVFEVFIVTFGMIDMIDRNCPFSRLDVVCDSYMEGSLKEGERRRLA